ncbi:hypothetical protein PPYR_00535 [Photinus pyralis]|uniref:Uncharacterized protein n=1 Tax=Photinus pyralis TaxID=7054 RepID=A0A5N4B1V2_PHOPY|nr:hypothetical protein PPYR_00535 [Photinus pyralis]
MKVLLIIGYSGASRREELLNIHMTDIAHTDNNILIRITKTKNNIQRQFAISNPRWVKLVQDNSQPSTSTLQGPPLQKTMISNTTTEIDHLAGISVHAAENSVVTIKVYNNCTITEK